MITDIYRGEDGDSVKYKWKNPNTKQIWTIYGHNSSYKYHIWTLEELEKKLTGFDKYDNYSRVVFFISSRLMENFLKLKKE